MTEDIKLDLWDLLSKCSGDKKEAHETLVDIATCNGNINIDTMDIITILNGVKHFSTIRLSADNDNPERMRSIIDQLNGRQKDAQRIIINIKYNSQNPLKIEELAKLNFALEENNKGADLIWGQSENPDSDKFEVSLVFGYLG